MAETEKPFWREKRLEQMTSQEWESLCDGCGLCCLEKHQDITTGKLFYSKTPCYQLDVAEGRCRVYPRRHEVVADCVAIDSANKPLMDALPPTCAYRLVHQGCDLPDWHPLKTRDADSTRKAGKDVGALLDLAAPKKPWKRWQGV